MFLFHIDLTLTATMVTEMAMGAGPINGPDIQE